MKDWNIHLPEWSFLLGGLPDADIPTRKRLLKIHAELRTLGFGLVEKRFYRQPETFTADEFDEKVVYFIAQRGIGIMGMGESERREVVARVKSNWDQFLDETGQDEYTFGLFRYWGVYKKFV